MTTQQQQIIRENGQWWCIDGNTSKKLETFIYNGVEIPFCGECDERYFDPCVGDPPENEDWKCDHANRCCCEPETE